MVPHGTIQAIAELLKQKRQMRIPLKSPYQIKRMQEVGQIVAQAHLLARDSLRPGITTQELNDLIEVFILAQGAHSSLKGYRRFPAATAICVNEEAIHGIPGPRVLQSGDIVSIDICVSYRGYHADSAWTYGVGELNEASARLLQTAERAMWAGIAQAQPEHFTTNIGRAVQTVAEAAGYSIVAEYGGHGIGRRLHERPFIPMIAASNWNLPLEVGMTFTVEPILCSAPTRAAANRWTLISVDGSLTAQFEHTIAITTAGTLVLTALQAT